MIQFGNMKHTDFLHLTNSGDESTINLTDDDIAGKPNKLKNLKVLRTYLANEEVFFLMQGYIDGDEHIFKISDLNFFYLLDNLGCKKDSKFEGDFVFIERLNELFLIPAKPLNPFYKQIIDLKKKQLQTATILDVKTANSGTVYLNKKGVLCVFLGSFFRLSGNLNTKGYATGSKVFVSVPLNTLSISKNYNVLNTSELENLTMSDLIIETTLKMFSAENQDNLYSDISSEDMLDILNTVVNNTHKSRLNASSSNILKSLFRALVDNRFNVYDLKKNEYLSDSENNTFVDLVNGLFNKITIDDSAVELTRHTVNSFLEHVQYLIIREAKMLFRINTNSLFFASRKDFSVYNIVDKESKIYSDFFKYLSDCNEYLNDYVVYYRKYLTQADKYIVENFVTLNTKNNRDLKSVLNLDNAEDFIEADNYFSNTVRNLDADGNISEIYTEVICTPNTLLLDIK